MTRVLSLILFTPLVFAGILPDRYIVELTDEPVAAHAARIRRRGESAQAALRRPEVEQHRLRVRAAQRAARAQVEQLSGEVMGQLENASNALLVHIPDAQAAALARIPGVKRVYPVRSFHLLLDHALPLHKVPEAWSQVGYEKAGAGVRIAIIDTGVDAAHPGFQDASMTAPDGFPRANAESDLAYTNPKVIVARSYASLLVSPDPDLSARDREGHGTATAMCAAGVRNAGPLATITGVAPKAWIGNYKVFGTPGVNDSASDAAILAALDDAVKDGMDVISLSLGSDIETRLADDPEVAALERVAALGIIVVAASGNNGPDPATVGSPANALSVIGVGATNNDRVFTASVVVGSNPPLTAIPGSGANSSTPITGPLVDVTTLDGNGLACATLPRGALTGSIAFILRGVCTFEEKLIYAGVAGAIGAVVYTDQARPDPIVMGVGAATLPAEMISYADGIAVKNQLKDPQQAILQFSLGPAYVDPSRLTDFSSKGPSVDFAIKPDMVAVGKDLYMAAQKLDPRGIMYSADGYIIEQGTSFSAPIVAGAAAVLKSYRPGLTAAQYRSLLVNSSTTAYSIPGTAATVQQAGAGRLDLSAALNANATATPVSLSFGSGPPDITKSRTLTIANVGTAEDTLTVSVAGTGTGPVPVVQPTRVTLAPGASADISVGLTGAQLAAGTYQGFLQVQSSVSSTPVRVPYWYGVASGVPGYVTLLYTEASPRANSTVTNAVLFKVTDASGIPVPDVSPDVTVTGTGTLLALRPRDSLVPNSFSVSLRMGPGGTSTVVHIRAGAVAKDVTLTSR